MHIVGKILPSRACCIYFLTVTICVHKIYTNASPGTINGTYPKNGSKSYLSDKPTVHLKTAIYDEKGAPIYCNDMQMNHTFYCPKINYYLKRFVCYNSNKNVEQTYNHDAYVCGCTSIEKKDNVTKMEQCKCESTMTIEPVHLTCTVMHNVSRKKEKDMIIIGVILPYSLGSSALYLESGEMYASAMYVALNDIKARENILTNHDIKIVWSDNECSKKNSVKHMIDMEKIYEVHGFIGGDCQQCVEMARLAATLDKPLISHVSLLPN